MDSLKGLLVVLAMVAVPLVGIGIGIAVATDRPQPQPQTATPAAPVPPPPAPVLPDPRPVPPLHSAEACQWDAPPQPGLMAECERRRLDQLTRETLRDTKRFEGWRPGGGPSWSPRSPSSPRPIPPYPAWPGDPNDRDHDGRSCESGCIN
jgi:hypothetical protein